MFFEPAGGPPRAREEWSHLFVPPWGHFCAPLCPATSDFEQKFRLFHSFTCKKRIQCLYLCFEREYATMSKNIDLRCFDFRAPDKIYSMRYKILNKILNSYLLVESKISYIYQVKLTRY